MTQAFLERVAQTCRRCPARIVWAVTDQGRAMPVDLAPDLEGNVAVHVDGAQKVRARVVTAERPVAPFERLHVPHFATCGQQPAARQDGVIPLYRKRAARRQTTPPPTTPELF